MKSKIMKSKITLLVLGAGALAVGVLTGCSSGNGGPRPGAAAQTFIQQDRLARPIVNEALATFANNRHRINNTNTPTGDGDEAGTPGSGPLATDLENFLTHPQHTRSPALRNLLRSVLVPDVMIADLSQNAPTAAYLGTETGGALGRSRFGGRALTDDVVDLSLQAVFGHLLTTAPAVPDGQPSIGLVPRDAAGEIPGLTTDRVGPGAKNFSGAFPYLGAPR